MSVTQISQPQLSNLEYYDERVDLACAFRWTVRFNWHESVANHFSLCVNEDGSQFLINPNNKHFSLIKASDLLLLDANDPDTMNRPDAPDATAWGLHGALHRKCPQARCALHVHSKYATVLASLADSTLPAIDQNSAIFYNRVAIDHDYGGLALDEEAERCCDSLSDPKCKVLVMGNHGIMVIGDSVADTFNRLYYFERAAETVITAYMTGRKLRYLSDEIAEKTASQIESGSGFAISHFDSLKQILDGENSDYRN